MTCGNMQIVASYEEQNMSPEDIAENYGYDISAVKAILLQYSQRYSDQFITRANVNDAEQQINKDVFGDEDFEVAKRAIVNLARDSEMEGVRLKAAQYIIDERKGRNDVRAIQKNQVNIVMFNEQVLKAREQMRKAELEAAKQQQLPKVVNV